MTRARHGPALEGHGVAWTEPPGTMPSSCCPAFPAGLRPSSRPLTVTPRAMAVDMIAAIKEKNDSNPVMVYSKTYCPCEQGRGWVLDGCRAGGGPSPFPLPSSPSLAPPFDACACTRAWMFENEETTTHLAQTAPRSRRCLSG